VGAVVFLVYPRQAVCETEVDAGLCAGENLAAKDEEKVTRAWYTRLQARFSFSNKRA
jgi:hypothetical protein